MDDKSKEKLKTVADASAAIEKQFGKGAIMPLGSSCAPESNIIPTGSVALDAALGIGGLPRGRVVEICGPPSSGKTTITLHAVARSQRSGGVCAFIDADHAFDPAYARGIGVSLEELLISQPDCAEQALEIADQLVRTGAITLIVVSSVAGLTPKAEIEGEMSDEGSMLQARLMSQALRKLTAATHRHNSTVVFLNHLSSKPKVLADPESQGVGNALKFYSSVRLDLRRISDIRDGDEIVGAHMRAKVIKNKCAPPFREADFDVMYRIGINRFEELVNLGLRYGFVKKSGGIYSLDGTRLGQRPRAVAFLAGHPDATESLRARLLTAMNADQLGGAAAVDPKED